MISRAKKKSKKTKLLAIVVASFAVFLWTLFAIAENKNSNSLFLDSDQDELTDQEEKMLGTDFQKTDTDGDGYSDGKEVSSGYNPLKPAPGDKIIVGAATKPANPAEKSAVASSANQTETKTGNSADLGAAEDLLAGTGSSSIDLSGLGFGELTNDALTNLSSDPQNPNLTNEMLGQLMQLSKEKGSTSEEFLANPSLTTDDYSQIAQKSLESTNLEQSLPEIKDSELKILSPVDDSPRSSSGGAGKKLEPKEVKEKQKQEIEKYLASIAYVAALQSPFAITNSGQLETDLSAESANLLNALSKGDQSKIDSYAEKAQNSIDQIKKIEVPYILKDFHKSTLALALYTLNMKDSVVVSAEDPMKGLASLSALQKVAEAATKLQSELKSVLDQYDIEFVNLP